MQSVNGTFNTIISGRYIVEYKIEIGLDTYTQSDIYGTPQISQSLFDKFSAGNAVAGTLKVTLKPKGTIPTMARLDVYFRVKNAVQTSQWYPKGKYYIDTRKLDENGYLSLECYDAMLKAEYTFMESGSWTSTTALATLGMIASDMGLSIETVTQNVMTDNPMDVDYVPVIGENGTTGREMLKYIASMYAGNFIIDEAGKLKLVQLIPPNNVASMNVLASSLNIAPPYDAIDRVIVYGLSGDEGFRSPNNFDELTGRILEVTCPWTSQTVADAVLGTVDGYIYQPLEATSVPLPPHYQLGDGITLNGTTSVINTQEIDLNPAHLCEISSPFEEEVNHEYPYRSPAQRVDDAVTKEDLKTAGRTTINGSNIRTGTITLGGDDNGNGILDIVDENDNLCGEWDNTGITVYDNSTLSGYLSTDNKLRIVRMGDDPDTAFGTLLGVGLYDDQQTYPDYRRPYINLRGKDTRGKARVAMLDAIAGLFLSLTDQSDNYWSVQIRPDTNYVPNPVTRTSGVSPSASLETWGRVAQLTFEFTANASYSANTNIFQGTLVDGYRPRTSILGVGYYGSSVYIGMISPSGTITIRACDAVTFQSQYPAYISWIWIFEEGRHE